MTFSKRQKMLLVAGAMLFLLGLLQGAVVQQFLNPRMALSAHLTAVQSGMALMIAGVIWSAARLSSLWDRVSLWTIVVGTYGLWFALSLSAATGASQSLPIAGEGYSSNATMEGFVSAAVLSSSLLMTIGWAVLAVGLVLGFTRPEA